MFNDTCGTHLFVAHIGEVDQLTCFRNGIQPIEILRGKPCGFVIAVYV